MQLIKSKEIDFYYLTDKEDIDPLAKKLEGLYEIGIDTEVYPLVSKYGKRASALDPHTSEIRLLQINWKDNHTPYIVDVLLTGKENLTPLIEQLKREDLVKIIFNSKYDLQVIRKAFDFWMPSTYCALVVMHRLGICTGFKASKMRGNSFKALCRDYFRVNLSKIEAVSDWSAKDLSMDQLVYAALDVGAPKSSNRYSLLLEGYYLLNKTVRDPYPNGYGCGKILDLNQKVNWGLAKVEYRGMPVNKHLLKELKESNEKELQERKLRLCKDLGLPVLQKVKMGPNGMMPEVYVTEAVSKLLNSPKKLVDLVAKKLEGLGYELTNLQAETLKKTLELLKVDKEALGIEETGEEEDEEDSKGEVEFGIDLIDNLLAYKKLIKALGTNYLDLINSVTGCVHSHYSCSGTSTDRMSSGGRESFNCQQIPQKKHTIRAMKEEQFIRTESKIYY